MEKASYGTDNIGHFGLSLGCYTHYTSPIRRLSDLIVNKSNNSKVELSDKEKLENLKSEYKQLEKEVENLKKNEKNLIEKIKMERNRKNIVPESEKFRFNLPDIKEKPFARNILIAIFAFSVLLGFYLIK